MNTKVRKMVLCSLMAALMAVCAWISVPIPPVTFTLQTFGVLMALGMFGGKWGTVSILLYLAMGLVGLPVFSGFRSGAAALLDANGGFLWGFVILAFLCGLAARFNKTNISVIMGIVGVILCHLTGIIQYCFVSQVDFVKAFLVVSLPFLPKDLLLAVLSVFLAKKIEKRLKLF